VLSSESLNIHDYRVDVKPDLRAAPIRWAHRRVMSPVPKKSSRRER